jgi:hypothetical protein
MSLGTIPLDRSQIQDHCFCQDCCLQTTWTRFGHKGLEIGFLRIYLVHGLDGLERRSCNNRRSITDWWQALCQELAHFTAQSIDFG